jgi:Co/Zn/Cd efflux system component
LTAEIRETIEADGVSRVRDLHVWRIGRDRFAAVVTIESAPGYEVRDARTRLAGHEELAHLTVEVHHRRETVQARPTAPPDA